MRPNTAVGLNSLATWEAFAGVRRRRCRITLLLVTTIAMLTAPSALAAEGPPALTFRDGNGLHILSQAWLDSRLVQLQVQTATLPEPLDIRILLPADYGQHPGQHYPALYLFDGTSGHASDWTTFGRAEQTTAGLPVIVVMPDITQNG